MVAHRHVWVNGINMHIAEQGEGLLVLLLHGWPETWYSWRHQIDAPAAAGYRVVAPDQRGYGATDRPGAVDQYSIFALVGDVVALIHELGGPGNVRRAVHRKRLRRRSELVPQPRPDLVTAALLDFLRGL